jgi:cytochrome c oxidase subunit IV
MSTSTEAKPAAHAEAHGHGGTALYTKTLIALLILTVLTVVAAGIDFGSGNVVIALTIATIKASLVALFFMHLRYDKPVNAIIAMAGFLFLGIFLMFCLLDAESRVNLLPANVHETVVPLAPGTAPAPLTEIKPGSIAGVPAPGAPEAAAKAEEKK